MGCLYPTITKEEYLRLIQEVTRQENESDLYNDVECDEYIPSEPIEKKILRYGTLNALNLKKDQIRKELIKCKYQQIEIGNFLIVIKDIKDHNYDIHVYETRFKTPTGRPCKMQYGLEISSDIRFKDKTWINFSPKYKGKIGYDIPEETFLDIIKYLQVIVKFPAFL